MDRQTGGASDHVGRSPSPPDDIVADLPQRYESAADVALANIASDAMISDAAGADLLFGVLVVYRESGFPGLQSLWWDGAAAHMGRAFRHVHAIGEQEAARRLRARVIERALPDTGGAPPAIAEPGRSAAVDQRLAAIGSRSIRAAQLLDPRENFDGQFIEVLGRL